MENVIQPEFVVRRYPSGRQFPPSCPSFGLRGDTHRYFGVQLKVWVVAPGSAKAAVIWPELALPLAVRHGLRRMRDTLALQLATLPTDHSPDSSSVDIGYALDGEEEAPLWGPTFVAEPDALRAPALVLLRLALHEAAWRADQGA